MKPFSRLQYHINTPKIKIFWRIILAFRKHSERTMNGSSQRKFRNLYSSSKPVVKMKLNNSITTQIKIPNQFKKRKSCETEDTRHQLANDILQKRNFDNHIWKQCIQVDAISYKEFHKTTSPREKDAKPLHSVTFEHPSKSGKLNGVGKIFLDLF